MQTSNLVSLEWLVGNLNKENVTIIDCRFELGHPEKGLQAYLAGHIPGALYFDLEKDLSGPGQEHGGRHPLPDLSTFIAKLSQAGIAENQTVIAYDDQSGAMAARLWWMLKYLGHEHVFVLNESFQAWIAKGLPTTKEVTHPTPKEFIAQLQPSLLVEMKVVRDVVEQGSTILIDSRASERYNGLHEDLDKKAGHIPGAVNEFWKDSLTAEGKWKSTEEQKIRLSNFLNKQEQDVIVYCGSGVTACVNVLAFQEVGLVPKLYLGSWSDWISYPENEIVSKKD